MTAQEARLIQQLSEFVRDWRQEDTTWKAETDERLRKVEIYIAADDARNKATLEAKATNRLNRGQLLTAAGIAVSLLLGLINNLH
jgi:t-SNARE complex subunit (syntaxin)